MMMKAFVIWEWKHLGIWNFLKVTWLHCVNLSPMFTNWVAAQTHEGDKWSTCTTWIIPVALSFYVRAVECMKKTLIRCTFVNKTFYYAVICTVEAVLCRRLCCMETRGWWVLWSHHVWFPHFLSKQNSEFFHFSWKTATTVCCRRTKRRLES